MHNSVSGQPQNLYYGLITKRYTCTYCSN